MSKNKVIELRTPAENESTDTLTELLRVGARKLIAQAVEIEVENYLSSSNEVLPDNKQRLVRNGYLPEREILTGIGGVSVKMPRVRDRGNGDKVPFKSRS